MVLVTIQTSHGHVFAVKVPAECTLAAVFAEVEWTQPRLCRYQHAFVLPSGRACGVADALGATRELHMLLRLPRYFCVVTEKGKNVVAKASWTVDRLASEACKALGIAGTAAALVLDDEVLDAQRALHETHLAPLDTVKLRRE